MIDYEGLINDKMAGFYRSKYDAYGKTKYIAVTQFQESDARRAFPCMDHPLKKAVFDIDMIVDENLTVISNTEIAAEEHRPDDKKRIRFEQTPKMSTYLLFFGVGEFDFIVDAEDERVRAVVLPGMAPYSRFGLEFGRKALRYCEEYYQIPYVLPKMDLIAIPDFAFGAMENWGAITFRENLLLHYPEITSKLGEMRICEVIAHEIAHQWFGNLVTPADWKYLWLNESFATYFGYGVLEHYHPEWRVWDHFLLGQTATAMQRDGLTDTIAIEIPCGEHNTSTAPIIYSKGSSILRIIREYIGPEKFRAGLTHFLQKYEYANASSHHLWESFEEASQRPVTALMKRWIEQPGFPVLEAKRNGRELTLTQKRFTYLPLTSDQTWMVPVTITVFNGDGEQRNISTLIDARSDVVDLGKDTTAYKINAGQNGFYRVKYAAPDDFDRIGRLVLNQEIAPEDRWGLQDDLFALVQSGDAGFEAYLDFLDYYEKENSDLPLSGIAGNMFQAYLVMDGNKKDAIAAKGKLLLEKIFDGIGYAPSPGEAFSTSILRDHIIWHAVSYGSKEAEDFATGQFNSLMQGKNMHQDIIKSVMMVGALHGRVQTFNWLIKRFKESASEHDRLNALMALGCFGNLDLIGRSLQFALENVPPKNIFVPIVSAAANPQAAGYMWDWFVAHIGPLEQIHPLLFERVIAGIVPVCGLEKAQDVNAFLEEYMQAKPQTADVIRLSLERLEINLRMRNS